MRPSAAATSQDSTPAVRLGLCCQFVNETDVRFRTTTAAHLSRLDPAAAREKLTSLAQDNAVALRNAVLACRRLQIRAFRVPSGLLPLATHPDWFYGLEEVSESTRQLFQQAGKLAREDHLRLSFHPDQFVVLGSPNPAVTAASLHDLRLHGQIAQLIGADAINLHAGGAYGDKTKALERVARTLEVLPEGVRNRLTFENDDRVYHVRDLLPFCRREKVPLTYDVHHHRCLPDGLSIAEATFGAMETWDREPLFHVSSPKGGWAMPNPRVHADLVDPADFPEEWYDQPITVDVEAKSKEVAVLALRQQLAGSTT